MAVVAVSFLSLLSCTNKETGVDPVNDNPYFMLPSDAGDGLIIVQGDFGAGDVRGSYTARASFRGQQPGSSVYAGSLSVDGFPFDTIEGTGSSYMRNPSFQPGGRIIPVVVDGTSEVNAFSDSIFVPEDLFLHKVSDLSKSGHTVTWAPSSMTSQVSVVVSYWGSLSQREDPSLPGNNIEISRVVPDNGSYTFSSEELAGFAVGGLASISIYRGTSKKLDVSGKTYYISSVLKSGQIDVPIVQ